MNYFIRFLHASYFNLPMNDVHKVVTKARYILCILIDCLTGSVVCPTLHDASTRERGSTLYEGPRSN